MANDGPAAFGPQDKNQPSINIELGEKEAEGIYSNLALIAHSASEFIVDFARVLPGIPKSRVYARIVMTPHHAKLLSLALEQNLKKYEETFGKINLPGDASPSRGIGF
ncbi:MAG TPA: DUF3467 domain-containing protein [Candidatus Saccharimonadales bacterium]|nr:DUF3467 domain-containing protein [Candidatus Saccharimonadales bacterium]